MTVENLPKDLLILEWSYESTVGGCMVLYITAFDKSRAQQMWIYINEECFIIATADYIFDGRFVTANIDCDEDKAYYEDCVLFMSDWSDRGLKDYKWLQKFVSIWNKRYEDSAIELK